MIKRDVDSDAQDVWTFDIETGKGTAITSDSTPDAAPVWSPDGRSIAYVSVRDNTHGIYRRAADGTGEEERLYQHTTGAPIVLTDWSADGRFLCFWSGDTMFILPLTGDRKADRVESRGFLRPRRAVLARQPFPRVQLERIRVAFRSTSDHSIPHRSRGQARRRAVDSARSQISTDGGIGGIVWRKDGKELFYLSQPPRQTVMAVDVTTSPAFEARTPRPLFEIPTPIVAPAQLSTVSSPDGQRFVFAVTVPSRPASK